MDRTNTATGREGHRVPVLLVTGPVGVGKTTVLYEVSTLLADAGVAHAAVDFDQLTELHPPAKGDDRFGTKIVPRYVGDRVAHVRKNVTRAR